MPLAHSIRSAMFLVAGLAVGGAGAILFQQSLPGTEGSPEDRAQKLEHELQHAQNRLAALEAEKARTPPTIWPRLGSHETRQMLADDTRRIAEDIRDGRPVNPDEIFHAGQPLMRALAPLLDRMRIKQQQQMIDSTTGELARKYHLTATQQEQLKQWFTHKADDETQRWNDLLTGDGTRLEDLMHASREVRPDDGLDAFMPSILGGENLARFQSERMTERAQRVENEADAKVQQLDGIVGLDESQRDQVFAIMARNSKDYDPHMTFEGGQGPITATPAADRQQAILAVLRPDQRAAYEAERQHRRDQAAQSMESLGLKLPENWGMWSEDNR